MTKCYRFGNMLKVLTNFRIHQKVLKYWFTLLQFVMDYPVLLQDIIKVDWCRKECGVVWPVQLCQTATMAGIYYCCPKIMRLFPSQTTQIWLSTPFKLIFWLKSVKTNVSAKVHVLSDGVLRTWVKRGLVLIKTRSKVLRS